MRPKVIDLYCGAGGASMGYHLAGFDVTGVDNEPHPDYPFKFVLADALAVLRGGAGIDLLDYDLIAGGPPCKSENDLRHLSSTQHPDLLTPTLAVLRPLGRPYIIENVDSTKKLHSPVLLCGAAYGLGAHCRDGKYRPLRRHRLFESNLPLMSSGCACDHREPVGVYGEGGGGPMTRGYKGHPEECREAMGIDWMHQRDLCQAIPPAYTRDLGEQALDLIADGRAA